MLQSHNAMTNAQPRHKAESWPGWVGRGLAWATLAATLCVSLLAWYLTKSDIEKNTQRRFDYRVAEIRFAVQARMRAQEQVLRGAGGLFTASNHVTRQEWRAYVAALELQEFFPGIQGIGFVQRLTPSELAAHVRAVRAEGFADYEVRPPGPRSEYTSIVYIEPFDWRNRRAFGYDMFSEPVRHAAMAAARDSGRLQISGKVTLVQETGKNVQSGFLMYLPVYRQGAPTDSVAQRRAALAGYVYCPLRMHDLMAGILGQRLPDVRLQIYDGERADDEALMYDSAAGAIPAREGQPAYSDSGSIEIEGHPWTLRVTSLPAFEASIPEEEAHAVLLVGILVSLLLFAVVWSLATLRERALAMATDMTAALRESREQFRAVTHTANDAIVTADTRGRIVYLNPAAERIFGYAEAEALDQPLTLLMPEPLRPRYEAAWQSFLRGGETHEVIGHTLELAGRRQDGTEFPLEVSVSEWRTHQGRFFTGILRDVTERYRAEHEIRQLNAELQKQVEQLAATNRELESFSYSVSHDLRAPLRAVDGFAGMLAEDFRDCLNADGLRLVTVIRDNSRRMGKLIDDLLSFSRLGRANLARSKIDMAVLAREAADEQLAAGNGKGADIAIGALPPACGDASLLRQVWSNLIGNALKFSRSRQPPRIDIGCERRDGETVYFVRDNGVGFDMAHAGQLFGVFQRLHADEDFPGTGVGLAIVHRIIEKHGGRIWAESQVDRGATFYFCLPGERNA